MFVPQGAIASYFAWLVSWIWFNNAKNTMVYLNKYSFHLMYCCCIYLGQITYKRWLWWSRFGILVMALQVAGATYLAIVLIKKAMNGHNSSSCYPGTLI
jgi:hypothetical protein